MNLKKVTRFDSVTLSLEWDDGHIGRTSLKTLRDACPCAGCKGETVLLEHYGPPPINYDAPGRYELKLAEAIGNYALKFTWADGHQEGLYSWPILRSVCECPQCSTAKGEGT
jgi:DUF971 family protein